MEGDLYGVLTGGDELLEEEGIKVLCYIVLNYVTDPCILCICIHIHIHVRIRIHIYIYIYIYICIGMLHSLIADSSDKGSDRGQNKSNIESTVTLHILSTVDSKGTNIGARKLEHRPKWSFRPS